MATVQGMPHATHKQPLRPGTVTLGCRPGRGGGPLGAQPGVACAALFAMRAANLQACMHSSSKFGSHAVRCRGRCTQCGSRTHRQANATPYLQAWVVRRHTGSVTWDSMWRRCFQQEPPTCKPTCTAGGPLARAVQGQGRTAGQRGSRRTRTCRWVCRHIAVNVLVCWADVLVVRLWSAGLLLSLCKLMVCWVVSIEGCWADVFVLLF